MRASRVLGLAAVIAAVGLLASTPGHANCPNGASVFQGIFSPDSVFQSCGDNAFTFYWRHQNAMQRLTNASQSYPNAAGVDSGVSSGIGDGVLQATANPGEYTATYDWAGPGDSCITLATEPDVSCLSGAVPTLGPNDFVIAGNTTANPLVATTAAITVDGNELNQFWAIDQAGAATVDGNPCAGDGSAGKVPGPIVCGAIPAPHITGSVCDATGCNLTVSVGSLAGIPILDDCNVAQSKAIDCPRNMLVGAQIMVKRAPCNATAPGNVATFDTRTYIMNSAAATITPNFVAYSPQDTNLNGVIDGAEVGPAVPVILAGSGGGTTTVRITKDTTSTDCAYLGVAVRLDVNPSTTGCGATPCESVVTPLVTASGVPISIGGATPVSDKVIDLVASKSAGKASVSWDTTAELQTAGFNLIGTKKNGGEVQLNSSLIQAKQGTSGNGASYSVGLSSGDLKGSTAVYVEVVKTNGAKERFGPASF